MTEQRSLERIGRGVLAFVCAKELGGLAGLWSTWTHDIRLHRHRWWCVGGVLSTAGWFIWHALGED